MNNSVPHVILDEKIYLLITRAEGLAWSWEEESISAPTAIILDFMGM